MSPERPRHPKKEIEEAIVYVEQRGWRIEKSSARAKPWGVMYCPAAQRGGCKYSISSTPRVVEDEARRILRAVHRCPHGQTGEERP